MQVSWLPAGDPFTIRAAKKAGVGTTGSGSLDSIAAFSASYAANLPERCAAYIHLRFTGEGDATKVHYEVCAQLMNIAPPIEAENPGFLAYAIRWYSTRRVSARLYLMPGLFWVEVT